MGIREKWEKFKKYPNEVRQFPRGKPISPTGGYFGGILYAANPVYIELSQGGTSPLRGLFASGGLFTAAACFFFSVSYFSSLGSWAKDGSAFFTHLLFLWIFFMGFISLGFALLFLIGPTDEVIRFDRKRQVLYKRLSSAGGVIEIPWSRLTPELRSWAHSAYFPGRYHQGVFIEYGEDGKPCETEGVQHMVAISGAAGHEIAPLMMMEAVRKYMEVGYDPAMRPNPEEWMYHGDMTWRVLFSLFDDEKGVVKRVRELREKELRRGLSRGSSREEVLKELRDAQRSEWLSIGVTLLAGPMMYPLFVLNLLIARFAARPKWPPELLAQHEADLAQLKLNAYGYPTALVAESGKGRNVRLERRRKQAHRERKAQERQQMVEDYRHYARLNYWTGMVVVPLALGSTAILVSMGFIEIPRKVSLWLIVLSWLLSSLAIFITLLTTPWAQKARAARAWATK